MRISGVLLFGVSMGGGSVTPSVLDGGTFRFVPAKVAVRLPERVVVANILPACCKLETDTAGCATDLSRLLISNDLATAVSEMLHVTRTVLEIGIVMALIFDFDRARASLQWMRTGGRVQSCT